MTLSIQDTTTAQARLQMIRLQLGWLEHEMFRLSQELSMKDPAQPVSASFSSLRGVWKGIDISTEEIAAARVSLSELL